MTTGPDHQSGSPRLSSSLGRLGTFLTFVTSVAGPLVALVTDRVSLPVACLLTGTLGLLGFWAVHLDRSERRARREQTTSAMASAPDRRVPQA